MRGGWWSWRLVVSDYQTELSRYNTDGKHVRNVSAAPEQRSVMCKTSLPPQSITFLSGQCQIK